MNRRPEAIVLLAALLSVPVLTSADEASPAPPADEAAPTTAPPGTLPPPAPSTVPEPPTSAGPQGDASVPPGQWVYTAQYGWIWLPYGDAYTYVPPSGYGEPYAYAYCADFGWSWIVAPWIWGYGPWPYFGLYGPGRFAWYGFGWWRDPDRWHWIDRDRDDFPSRRFPRSRPAFGGRGERPLYGRPAGSGGGAPVPTFRDRELHTRSFDRPMPSGGARGGGMPSGSHGGGGYGRGGGGGGRR